MTQFAHTVYLQRVRVKFVYEAHGIKVKITGANKSKKLIPAM